MNEVGERIKQARTSKGITQKELAERIGVTQQNLAQYERGKRNPKIKTIKRFAQALNIPLMELIPIDNVCVNEHNIKQDFNKKNTEASKSIPANKIRIHIDTAELDKAIEKANRLKQLLQDVLQAISELSSINQNVNEEGRNNGKLQ